jgi:hypothetical protein
VKVSLVVLELSAMLALPGFAVAQATVSPNESVISSITCVPLAMPSAPPRLNHEPLLPRSAMCTAANRMTWQGKMIGVNNDQAPVAGSVNGNPAIEHSHDGTALSAGDAQDLNRKLMKMRLAGDRPMTSDASKH